LGVEWALAVATLCVLKGDAAGVGIDWARTWELLLWVGLLLLLLLLLRVAWAD
jgi:hypothetical protein